MKDRAGQRWGLCVLLGFGTGCASLPSPLATYPKMVDVVEIKLKDEAETHARFGWPAQGSGTSGKFDRFVAVNSEYSSREVGLSCTWELSGNCPSLITECALKDRNEKFKIELQKNGQLILQELVIAPLPHGQELQLLEMNSDEINGLQFRKTLDEPQLFDPGQVGANTQPKWGLQLAVTDLDPQTKVREARRKDTDALEFNLLYGVGDDAYVAVHTAHPAYEATLALLVTTAHLYVHNVGTFGSCEQ